MPEMYNNINRVYNNYYIHIMYLGTYVRPHSYESHTNSIGHRITNLREEHFFLRNNVLDIPTL